MKNNQSLPVFSERGTTIFLDRESYIAGLFGDEQAKDALQSDK